MQQISKLDSLGMRLVDLGWSLLEALTGPGPLQEDAKRALRKRAWELIQLGGQVEEHSAVVQRACQEIKLGHTNHHTEDKIVDLARVREQRKAEAAQLLEQSAA